MKAFIHDNFLLQTSLAQQLYHGIAKELPIIDYHNHLNPLQLASDHRFANIAQLWILPDQYKHRAMRINGIPEKGITGNAKDRQKFLNWTKTFPKTIGNPLFHWSCMELKSLFGIDELLNESNAMEIWDECNSRLQTGKFSAIQLLKQYKTELLCTSDDLLADLSPHVQATQRHGIQVLPSLRGDTIVNIGNNEFNIWRKQLSTQTQINIKSLEAYEAAIRIKLDDFEQAGCLLADHALDAGFRLNIPSKSESVQLFNRYLSGEKLKPKDSQQFQSYMLIFLGKEYAKRNWALQLHIGAQRYTSTRLRKLAGSAGGYACIGKTADVDSIVRFLDAIEQGGGLARTILYTLNPMDNESFASITGSFTEEGIPGKVQFGPAWWYNDHYEGLKNQLIALSNYGLMSHFIGMTTDSRSILSFSRHEYFRRVLCDLLGEWVQKGHLPNDWNLLTSLVSDICYTNIKNWITPKKTIYVSENIEQ